MGEKEIDKSREREREGEGEREMLHTCICHLNIPIHTWRMSGWIRKIYAKFNFTY